MKFNHTKDYGKDRFGVRQAPYDTWGIWDNMNHKWFTEEKFTCKLDALKELNKIKSRHRR